MTPERILEIAKSNGVFVVGWRWRDDKIRRMCKRLCEKKLLRANWTRDGYEYTPVNAAPQPVTPRKP